MATTDYTHSASSAVSRVYLITAAETAVRSCARLKRVQSALLTNTLLAFCRSSEKRGAVGHYSTGFQISKLDLCVDMAQDIPPRTYAISKCFACQDCLLCGATCVYDTCLCDPGQEPQVGKKKSIAKAAIRRTFSPLTPSNSRATSFTQLTFLEACNNHFGYGADFTTSFPFSVCSTCHSRYQQAKKKNVMPFTSPSAESPFQASSQSSSQSSETSSQTSSQDFSSRASDSYHQYPSESDDSSSMQPKEQSPSPLLSPYSSFMSVDEFPVHSLKLQLLVKQVDGASMPLKWINISCSDFSSFEDQVHNYVQKLPALDYKESKCLLSYKPSNTRALPTSVADEDDFNIFREEYEKVTRKGKSMTIIATLSPTNNKKKSGNKKRKNVVKNYTHLFIFSLYTVHILTLVYTVRCTQTYHQVMRVIRSPRKTKRSRSNPLNQAVITNSQ
jgi:hypothetical protein